MAEPAQPETVDNTQNSPEESDQVNDPTFGRKVFVGNMSFRTNFKSLKEGFQTVGQVEKVNVISRNGRRLGFGFVQFATEEDAEAAVAKLNNTELDGRTIKVEISRSVKRQRRTPKAEKADSTDSQQGKKAAPAPKKARKPRRPRIPRDQREESEDVVYIRGFDESFDEDALRDLFKDFGFVSAAIRKGFRRSPKTRFAFVTVDSAENQEKAVAALNDKEINGETLVVNKAFKMIPVPEPEENADAPAEPAQATKPKKKRPRRKKKPADGADSPSTEATSAEQSPAENKPKRKRATKPKAKKVPEGGNTESKPASESAQPASESNEVL